MKNYSNLIALAIAFLLLFLLLKIDLLKKRHNILNDTILIRDTQIILISDTIKIDSFNIVNQLFIDTFQILDTIKILSDYQTIFFYDTTFVDSLVKINFKASVFKNKLQNGSFYYSIYDIKKQPLNNQNKRYYLIGLNAGFNKADFLFYIQKNKKFYGAGYDIYNKAPFFSFLFKF